MPAPGSNAVRENRFGLFARIAASTFERTNSSLLEADMQCADIMKTSIESVSPADTVEAAASRMRDEGVGFLPVCDDSQRVIGTLTDRDIATRLVAFGMPCSTTVEDIMTREIVACPPEDDLQHAAELMAKSHKSRLMCIDDTGHLAGVISLSDIAQYDGKSATDVLREVSAREAHA